MTDEQQARLQAAIEKDREPLAAVIAESIKINPPKVERNVCHDCMAVEGEIHELGCDMERCPFCGGQLISCDCCYEILGIDCSEDGMTEEQSDLWNKTLEEKGRVPYIVFPNMCGRCGKLWPDLFMVPTADWEKYVPLEHRRKILCLDCYKAIKYMVEFPEGIRDAATR